VPCDHAAKITAFWVCRNCRNDSPHFLWTDGKLSVCLFVHDSWLHYSNTY